MFSRFAGLLAVFLAWLPGPVSAEPRQPTGQWVVNFDDAQCFAARNYGSVENPIYLVIKAPPMGRTMQLSVMREGYTVNPEQQKGTVQFDSHPPVSIQFFEFEPAKSRLRTFLANMALEDFKQARTAASVRITTPGVDERFALTSMSALLKTMDNCVQDLRRVWNVSEAVGPNPLLKEKAKGNLQGLLNWSDYPTQAVAEGGTGTVATALLIDENGKVADCSIVAPSGVPVLDAQACAALSTRAQFKPAIGWEACQIGAASADHMASYVMHYGQSRRWRSLRRRDKPVAGMDSQEPA